MEKKFLEHEEGPEVNLNLDSEQHLKTQLSSIYNRLYLQLSKGIEKTHLNECPKRNYLDLKKTNLETDNVSTYDRKNP